MPCFRRWLLLAALPIFCIACQTTNVVVPEGLSPVELFQAAQEASSQRNHRAAMQYYQTYLERFPLEENPEQLDRNLWAAYEIAFLHHKLGDDRLATELLTALVQRYDTGPPNMPPAQRILALRVLEEIERGRREAPADEQAA